MAYRMLAAVDLGPVAEQVLGSAGVLTQMLEGELHVRHVCEAVPPGSAPSSAAAAAVERDEELLEILLQRSDADPTTAQVLIGRPADAIVEAAEEVGADLIVLGPHAGGELGARVFGTTADRVVRRAQVPCLVVRERMTPPVTRIIVPTDFSPAADAAVNEAGVMVRMITERTGTVPEVHLLHVGWPLERVEDPQVEERLIQPRLAAAGGVIGDACENARPQSHVLWGTQIADEIIDWTEQQGGGLIVMGTTGASGMRSRLLGSVAARVARRTTSPVLLVPFEAARDKVRERSVPRLACVVTGTDFSAASVGAAEWVAADFAPGARHVLLHAVELPDAIDYAGDGADVRGRLMSDLRAQAEVRLGELHPDVPASDGRVIVGRAADALAHAARENAADLIAIGGHPHPRGHWSVLGTTAEQLIRCSPVPVLIVRGRPASAPRRILASVDGSRQTSGILSWARMLAALHGATIHIVHVLNARYIGAARLVSGMRAARELDRSYEDQAESWLRDLASQAGIEPGMSALTVTTGEAAHELLALQQRTDADLVLVGSRGAGAVGRTLIGSVSYAVIRGATCPVLVIRGDEAEAMPG